MTLDMRRSPGPCWRARSPLSPAAGSGIGRAGAEAMARHGAHVIVTDLDGAKADQVVDDPDR